jgi:hypothetical protein
MEFAGAVDKVISEHLAELGKPGVVSIRPGYQAAGHGSPEAGDRRHGQSKARRVAAGSTPA